MILGLIYLVLGLVLFILKKQPIALNLVIGGILTEITGVSLLTFLYDKAKRETEGGVVASTPSQLTTPMFDITDDTDDFDDFEDEIDFDEDFDDFGEGGDVDFDSSDGDVDSSDSGGFVFDFGDLAVDEEVDIKSKMDDLDNKELPVGM